MIKKIDRQVDLAQKLELCHFISDVGDTGPSRIGAQQVQGGA